MVLGRIPVYSATCMSFGPDCSDIRRAISISALEMCRRVVGVVISCLPNSITDSNSDSAFVCIFRAKAYHYENSCNDVHSSQILEAENVVSQ